MKKLLLFCGVFGSLMIVAPGFVTNNNTPPSAQRPTDDPIACSPSLTYDPAARKFVSAPFTAMVRKNIYSLSASEISSLKTGITAMEALPYTNKTSWLYQAAIHGTHLTDHLPSWNMCQHGTQFFLSWHRMYLYFFERILRAKSGDPNLTLPYWDYQSIPVIPPDYRANTPGNPLYHARNASMNAGGSLPSSIMTSINSALDLIPFLDFQTSLEGPHGSVHVAIGGDMADIQAAAKDPIFWLHHANIDRLWEFWRSKCAGRANPTTSPWTTQVYTFFDENGNAVNMTGSQVVNTAASLNYIYQNPGSYGCPAIYRPWIYKIYPLLRFPEPLPFEISQGQLRKSFAQSKTDDMESFMKQHNKRTFTFSSNGGGDRLFIELNNINVNKLPEGVIEVYLNLGPNEEATPKSKSFVGVLDLFTAAHNMEGMRNMGHNLRINADRAAQALGLTIADLSKAEVSFVVRGNTMQGREIKTAGSVKVGSIGFAIDMAEK